jgi:hypothetical protein
VKEVLLRRRARRTAGTMRCPAAECRRSGCASPPQNSFSLRGLIQTPLPTRHTDKRSDVGTKPTSEAMSEANKKQRPQQSAQARGTRGANRAPRSDEAASTAAERLARLGAQTVGGVRNGNALPVTRGSLTPKKEHSPLLRTRSHTAKIARGAVRLRSVFSPWACLRMHLETSARLKVPGDSHHQSLAHRQ